MLSKRLCEMRRKTRRGEYRPFRVHHLPPELVEEDYRNLSPYRACARSFRRYAELEMPVILPGDRFFFTRTVDGKVPPGPGKRIENLSPDWEILLREGLSGRLRTARAKLSGCRKGSTEHDYFESTVEMLETAAVLSGRYAEAAEKAGDSEGARLLRRVPFYPAENLREALQSVFFFFSMLHLTGVTLLGFGRLDQYLAPYFRNDPEADGISRNEALELLSEFFLMLNRDSDLYGMVQLGDDGESVMLGGCGRSGENACNELTKLVLEAAFDVSMINPKINLRVDSRTPGELLVAGAGLTGRGLGFPQYCNDEAVIPGLCEFGYPVEDARDYTVAACWEFVVKNGRDIPNRMSVNLPLAVDCAIRSALEKGESFEELLEQIAPEIRKRLPDFSRPETFFPNPLFSAFSGQCLERGKDLNAGGGDHYHCGCHGCGSSTAADSLAAVKKWVYDEKKIAPAALLDALERNYEGYDDIRDLLKSHSPKTGNNDSESNRYLQFVFNAFAGVLGEIRDCGRGGRIRPGTGSAQNYALMTQMSRPDRLRATADGRRDGEYISSSLSPAPGVRARGILSILRTYGRLDYRKLCNGGPITLELSPSYFHSEDALLKTAQIIRAFVEAGCQQLQINTLDPELLREAQKHPENHRDRIVRVWGWSGYFVELDKMYQDQIIGRQAYAG